MLCVGHGCNFWLVLLVADDLICQCRNGHFVFRRLPLLRLDRAVSWHSFATTLSPQRVSSFMLCMTSLLGDWGTDVMAFGGYDVKFKYRPISAGPVQFNSNMRMLAFCVLRFKRCPMSAIASGSNECEFDLCTSRHFDCLQSSEKCCIGVT